MQLDDCSNTDSSCRLIRKQKQNKRL